MQSAGDRHGPTRAVHVGRQPIYDRRNAVVAYELLFREDAAANEARRSDAAATIDVIINTFSEFGLADIVEDKLCFVNVTRDFLVGDLPLPFGPEQTVLEILETVEVDDQVVDGVAQLATQGYRIALDDFLPGSPHERLLPLVTVVKLDMLASSAERVRAAAAACAGYPGITLLAEKVETAEHLATARDVGCVLFQGYALSRPSVVTGVTLSPSRLHQVELLTTLSQSDVDMREVISLVSRDPALSLRLLRVSNSAASGVRFQVSSVRQAVLLLGTARVREWVALMVLGNVANGADPSHLSAAVARARMCHQLAGYLDVDGDTAFTAGLLVGISELLGTPVAELAGSLPLSQELTTALRHDQGRVAQLLRAVLGYERADLTEARAARLPPARLVQAYLNAAVWTTRMVGSVLQDGAATHDASPAAG
ncbi:MAG TPA: HDOD domain-containing protein [Rugosimonospora sp.]|nr:HDOD domain-containing protein [Rugosimonospora sp.]